MENQGNSRTIIVVLALAVALAASSCAWVGRASVSSSGVEGDDDSSAAAVSADGRYLVFQSDAGNLAGGFVTAGPQIYRRDLINDVTELVSFQWNCSLLCLAGNGGSHQPDISADGRYVVFHSDATNLVSDSNGTSDVFLVDMVGESISRLSQRPGFPSVIEGNGPSRDAVLSGDGLSVVFESDASNLVPGDGNGATDVFRFDLGQLSQPALVSVAATGGPGDAASSGPVISGDGQVVAFASLASDLVAGQTVSHASVYRRAGGVNEPLVLPPPAVPIPPAFVEALSIDDDGDRVVSWADYLIGARIEVWDATGGIIRLIDGPPLMPPALAAIDGPGTRLIFAHQASGFVATLTPLPGSTSSFVERVLSEDIWGGPPGATTDLDLSDDGQTAVFTSADPALVPDDTNGSSDVFAKSIPFVEVDGVDPGTVDPGESTTIGVFGYGFGDDPSEISVSLGAEVTVDSVTLVDDGELSVDLTVAPGGSAGLRNVLVAVQNTGTGGDTGSIGLCEACLAVT